MWTHAVLWRPFWKWRQVEILRCRESIQDIIIYLHMKFRWNRTMLNLWGIVAAIFQMATGRNFSMSGINSGHHNLPTYEMSLKSDNVEFGTPLSTHISNFDDIGQCWIFAVLWRPFWKWRLVEIFQCRDIIIYPHIKFWYRTMLNFYRPLFMPCFGSHFENFENAELLL